jgi:hypothetical protein
MRREKGAQRLKLSGKCRKKGPPVMPCGDIPLARQLAECYALRRDPLEIRHSLLAARRSGWSWHAGDALGA